MQSENVSIAARKKTKVPKSVRKFGCRWMGMQRVLTRYVRGGEIQGLVRKIKHCDQLGEVKHETSERPGIHANFDG